MRDIDLTIAASAAYNTQVDVVYLDEKILNLFSV